MPLGGGHKVWKEIICILHYQIVHYILLVLF